MVVLPFYPIFLGRWQGLANGIYYSVNEDGAVVILRGDVDTLSLHVRI